METQSNEAGIGHNNPPSDEDILVETLNDDTIDERKRFDELVASFDRCPNELKDEDEVSKATQLAQLMARCSGDFEIKRKKHKGKFDRLGAVVQNVIKGQYQDVLDDNKTKLATRINSYSLKKIAEQRRKDAEEAEEKRKEAAKVIGYLFYFKLLNGFEKMAYMTVAEAEAHGKRYSQTYQKSKGRWVEDFDNMALKTVVKLTLGKWGIMSVDMQTAYEKDGAKINADGTHDYIDTTAAPAQEAEPLPAPSLAGLIEQASGADKK